MLAILFGLPAKDSNKLNPNEIFLKRSLVHGVAADLQIENDPQTIAQHKKTSPKETTRLIRIRFGAPVGA